MRHNEVASNKSYLLLKILNLKQINIKLFCIIILKQKVYTKVIKMQRRVAWVKGLIKRGRKHKHFWFELLEVENVLQ